LLGKVRAPRRQEAILMVAIVVLGFLFTIQVRSQATAERLLNTQDNVTLALLITGLAQANEHLVETRADLNAEAQKLQADANANRSGAPALQTQVTRIQVLDGSVPVHGPGITVHVAFALQSFELEDVANALRQLGAEAIAINNHRLTAKSVIGTRGDRLTVNGEQLTAPYDIGVIGDPTKLSAGAQSIVGTLKARGDVTQQVVPDIHITAVVPDRPLVYSSFGQ
jgi:uncharacterized protein YlxW (UPF0749 family)